MGKSRTRDTGWLIGLEASPPPTPYCFSSESATCTSPVSREIDDGHGRTSLVVELAPLKLHWRCEGCAAADILVRNRVRHLRVRLCRDSIGGSASTRSHVQHPLLIDEVGFLRGLGLRAHKLAVDSAFHQRVLLGKGEVVPCFSWTCPKPNIDCGTGCCSAMASMVKQT